LSRSRTPILDQPSGAGSRLAPVRQSRMIFLVSKAE
jgi:hypothetical protein